MVWGLFTPSLQAATADLGFGKIGIWAGECHTRVLVK